MEHAPSRRENDPVMSYLICATPRSGSTLLCDALGRTGIAGRPAEHFEVLLETGRPRQPRDYFQRSNDPAVLANIDDGPSKDLVLSNGLADRPIPEERLFDLLYDPNEAHNLADDPAHADVLQEMRGRLQAWMEETDDPLLHGPVPAPVGAEINTRDQRSPDDPPVIVT
jgi:Stf0 sulphotransferase